MPKSIITLEEVEKAIKSIKNGKAPGPDQIHGEFLKYGGVPMIRALFYLFNAIWLMEKWPQEWRGGIIHPIYKSGDQTDTDNYRAITLTSSIAKTFENIINYRLMEWVETNDILVDAQGGFRAQRATVDQILLLYEIVAIRREERLPTFLGFLDVKKAYDKTWREGLYKRMMDEGIKGKPWRIMKEILNKVIRKVKVGKAESDDFICNTGVPQGSVLSPLQYALFINGLAKELNKEGMGITIFGEKIPILLYADDIILVAEFPQQLQQMFDIAYNFSINWKFEYNTKSGKSNVMICGTRRQISQYSGWKWTLGSKTVENVKEYKYLGLELINSWGTGMFNAALERLIIKTNEKANKLLNMCHYAYGFKPKLMVHLWKTLIRPLLEYGCQVWGPLISETIKKKLETMQCKFLRAILACPGASQIFVRSECNLELLETRIDKLALLYWAKIKTLDPKRRIVDVLTKRMEAVKLGRAKRSWCCRIRKLLNKYNINENVKDLNKQIRDTLKTKEVWTMPFGDDPKSKEKLYLNDRSNVEGTIIKTRLRAGSLLLMDRVAKLMDWPSWMGDCPVCNNGNEENNEHFLLGCEAYNLELQRFIEKLDANDAHKFVIGTNKEKIKFLLSSASNNERERLREKYIKHYINKIWKIRGRICGNISVKSKKGIKMIVLKR